MSTKTPATTVHVFVSSTWLDLQPEREAVETALQRLRETKFVGMEYFGSRGEDTRCTSLDEVDRSQVYVGIFGGRYGSGITEAEYRRARELGLPCFIYLKDETAIPPEGRETDSEKATLLAALKAELLEHHTLNIFTAPDDLAARVTADLHRWLFDVYLRPPVGIPFQAPAVPRYFVPRPEMSQALMDYLTADTPPGALVVSAVHGLGGIGKTTLVAALAHTPDVQARLPDGVLWVTLGQEPDVLSLLAGWIQALGDYDFRPTVVESASAHLRTLLHDKACLLVADDAWKADHARPFLVGGRRCRLVVTTRNAALARKVGARLYDLDVMTETQALALFQARLGPLDGDREQAAGLARELGYLPLALELAAAQVEAGLSWTELLDAFRQALADLAALDLDEATYRNESLRLSFRLSLEQLSPDDQDAFAWLGVLPKDARLNPAMAAMLWDQPEADARKRLRRLRDRALLKQVSYDRYTLHDLLHNEAKLWLVERMPLPEAHAVVLEQYRQKIPDGQWHRLSDDGYIYEHLTWHMEQAGRPEAIHALLREETAERKDAWYEAREALGQTAGYLDDVHRAWRLAEEELAICQSPFAIGLQCRYALIVTSLNSLATNIPPALLVALVENEVWTPAQALAYARQVLEPRQRAEALAGLIPHLPEPYRAEALGGALVVARAIRDESDRLRTLATLAPHLPEALLREVLVMARVIRDEWGQVAALVEMAPHLSEVLLTEALAVARAIEWKGRRAKALAGLAPYLPEALLREALAVAQEVESKWAQATALIELVPRLAELGHPQEALATARAIEWEGDRAEALIRLAPHLPEALLREVLVMARAIRDEGDRAKALAGLVPCLPKAERAEVLEETLAAAQVSRWESAHATALARLAPYLSEVLLRKGLAAVQEIEDEQWRVKALTGLAPHLPEVLLREALAMAREIGSHYKDGPHRLTKLQELLATAREIGDEQWRVKALAGVALRLAELGHPQKALAVAWEIGNGWRRAEVLVELAFHLVEIERAEVLREALAAAWAIGDEDARVVALTGLAPHLPEALLRDALAAARAIKSEWQQAAALARLAHRLAELDHPQEALAVARAIEDGEARVVALAGLVPHLSEPLRGEILDGLAPHLPEALLSGALSGMRMTKREWHWVEVKALAGTTPHLSEPLLRDTLAAAQAIEDGWLRMEALAGLAPHLPETERTEALRGALVAARAITDENVRVVALARLIPHLPESERAETLQEALAAVQAIGHETDRAKVLASLTPYMPETERAEALQEALTAAREIEDEDHRAMALAGLVPHLPEAERTEALREALVTTREIRWDNDRTEALARLALHLAQLPRQRLYPLWQETLHFLAARTRKDLLANLHALSPVIAALGEEEAIAETFRAIQDVGRWWP